MTSPTNRISLRLPEDVKEDLRLLSQHSGLSVSHLVRKALGVAYGLGIVEEERE